MMSRNLRSVNVTASRYLAAQAHAKSQSAGQSHAKAGQVQVQTLPSGITLASVAADTAMARVAVSVKAGARYEPSTQLGISHVLRSAAGFSTPTYTNFGLSFGLEYTGSSLTVEGTRDTITYLLSVQKEEDNLLKHFSMLAETINQNEFRQWEIDYNNERLKADLSVLEDSPSIQLAEALHQAAFKGGLRNSLYVPRYNLNKFSQDQLLAYVKERLTGPNTSIVGIGLEHQELLELVGKHFPLNAHKPGKGESKFIGGQLHLGSQSPLTYVALAAEGAGLKSPKDAVALALFQQMLGPGQGSQIQNSAQLSQQARLGRALSAALSGGKTDASDVAVSAFSLNFEDTGLFGFNLIAPATADVAGLAKSAVKELRAAAASVTDAELNDAKKNLKTAILLNVDTFEAQATELAQQLLLAGGRLDIVQEIDSISAADVKSAAGRLLKSKLALATVGPNAPFLEDIVPELL